MNRIPTSHLRFALSLIIACVSATTADADCVRWKPTPGPPNVAPDLDGPGSFGELQDTVTLDCLKYVGSVQKDGEENVLIKDERGKVHRLKLYSYMGENSGIINKITPDAIYIQQAIEKNGDYELITVKFYKQ